MSVNWTKQQLEAISARSGNILVAAAAGSGKTAVLVERIIRIITDAENPVSVDRLLVLTFTEAAASEMKRKIAAAIDKKLEENPDNEWLREQSIKVGSACISTIHAFCSRILSNNAHLTDLPSDFSLIDDTENKVLQAKALDAVMESYYNHIDKKDGFRNLVMGWGGIKGDESLRETIIKLHDFSRSLAYPKKWLHNACHNGYIYIKKGGSVEDSVWAELIKFELFTCAQNIADGLRVVCAAVEREIPSDHDYYSYYYNMTDDFRSAFSKIQLGDNDCADRLRALLGGFKIKNAPKRGSLDEEVTKRINKLRDDIVKGELKHAAALLSAADEENTRRIAACAPVVKTLCSIVRQVERVHQRYKKEKSVIDFSDLEHGLLNLLCNEKGEITPLCLKLREYYHEILLDEFQDTNQLQFEVFSHLSKECGNLFMVGDVKQCIYKFRNADPSIFMRLYTEYGRGDGGRLIRLFKNFRSRAEVIDSVNFIFSSVMSKRVGGVEYNKDEYLINGAAYESGSDYNTEVIVCDVSAVNSDDSLIKEIGSSELEAKNAAQYIKDLVCGGEMLVTDKESGELRKARFGDIAVLCRGGAGCNNIETALAELGIASVSDTGQNYLGSVEVTTVICFLQIIDNPLQDIPLIAVMRSPMFGFCADELAKIRACAKGRFYTAVEAAAKTDSKAAAFVDILNNLRGCAKYMGTDELVWKICNELHYFSIAGAMPNGERRRANLKLLLERCSDYEQGTLTGLFNFIKYIEMLRESKKDMTPAKDNTDNTAAVRIMTIHKSKGLEFPIVFMLGTSKKFNLKDIQREIIWDADLGIGLDLIDTRQRIKFKVSVRNMIESSMLRSLKAEELRLLYVAMTRAKEKLIISATVSSRDNRWMDSEFDEDKHLYPILSDRATSMRDWIFSALISSPDAAALRERAGKQDIIPRIDSDAHFNVSVVVPSFDTDFESNSTENSHGEKNEKSAEKISERLDYTYPYADLSRLPIKLSVSELKRRRMPDEDYSTGLLRTPSALITDTSEIGAAERGTITHFVLQHIDIAKTERKTQIEEQIRDMTASGMISEAQGEVVDVDSIYSFFASDLGIRLKNSDKFEREFDFYMLVSPNEVDKDVAGGADDVILQGIADCFFYEDDGVVLIDYKTDRVGKSGIQKRSELYRLQIEYYSRGLEAILGTSIKERYLYFLNCGEAVKM